jgi:nucleoside-diphosphate-sugar epimerase
LKLLVTGANGFVGRVLCAYLRDSAYAVRPCVRHASDCLADDDVAVGDLLGDFDYAGALSAVDVVVHLAARVHQMREDKGGQSAEAAYRAMNVEVTRRLLEQAILAGVKRFVLVSTIKVNGEATPNKPFTEDDVPAPADWYARSKLEAEVALRERAEAAGMEWVIVRPTLIFGPGVRGNVQTLVRALRCGLPLPIGCVRARRSYLSVRNFAQLLSLCAVAPAAAGQIFLAADSCLSTPELARAIGHPLRRKVWLLPIPVVVLRCFAKIPGLRGAIERLTGSLEVDASKAARLLGWQPRQSFETSLAETVESVVRGLKQ